MRLAKLATGAELEIKMAAGRCVEAPSWTADGHRFSFRATSADAVEPWLADATTGEAHAIPGVRPNPILGDVVQWMPDQKSALVKLVPDNVGPPPAGPRSFEWRATEPATLTWAEALDGGDGKAKVPARDTVMMQKAPFLTPPVEILRTEQRYSGFS